jgi:cystatin-A/B
MVIQGGLSDTKNSDDTIQNIVNNLKNKIQEKTKKEFNKFEVHSYKTQIVAGTNYFVKLNTDGEFMHVRIFKSLPPENNFKLIALEVNKNEKAEIEYFI